MAGHTGEEECLSSPCQGDEPAVYEESCDGVDGEEVLVASLALEGVEQGPVYLHVQVTRRVIDTGVTFSQVDSEGLLTLNAKDSTGTARHGLTFGPLEDSNAA
eukprot:765988-Hanusia_phi.AAC.11